MSAQSGSDGGAEPLGVRRQVELPEADMDAAGGLAPADSEPEPEAEGGEAAPADAKTAEGAEAKESAAQADTATRDIAVSPAAGDGAVDGMPPDRPKKPVLAAVAIGGAIVLAVPILLIGTGSHDEKKHRTAAAANTVLSGNGQQQLPGAYTSTSPTPTATPTPTPTPKHKPKATKSAEPKHSAKPPAAGTRAHSQGVPSGEKPKSGGNPYALEVHSPYVLRSGKTLRTNRLALTMQKGGNLVLRDTSSKIIWSTGTHKAGVYAEFQTDGNLVVYAGGRKAIWAAGTFGHSAATLVLQTDYNMVIFDRSNPLWATGTNR